jgi:hypothetical protein
VLILRIKRAEAALHDGRLEEALAIARRDDVRSHRRGHELARRLVVALLARGREHLAARRADAALADAKRALELAGERPDVLHLQQDAADAMLCAHRHQRQAAALVSTARRQVEDGHLSLARDLLLGVDGEASRLGTLMQELDARQLEADSALQHATEAMARQDWEIALGELARARSAHASDERIRTLAVQIEREVASAAAAAIDSGRIDQAARLADRLALLLEPATPLGRDLVAALNACRSAQLLIDRGKAGDAIEPLQRVQTLFPAAAWVEPTLQLLRTIDEATSRVRGGPLGLLAQVMVAETLSPPPEQSSRAATPTSPRRPAAAIPAAGLPSRFLLHVDGVGSFLVLTTPRVTIGPVSGAQLPDVALVADPGAAVATIERVEDDYFLRAATPVAVNDQPCTSKLLSPGDRIALSPRCRVGFVLPHAATTTAAIDLVGARYPRADVRRILLMDRELVLGPGGAAHVRADGLDQPVVLVLRDGRLLARSPIPLEAQGRVLDAEASVPLDTPIRAGSLGFVLTRG